MSYQVLARKWRPKRFRELIGQEHVVRALSNALSSDRLHHAYLFTGTRGVGKTTVARVFAKCLNCEGGVTAEPCGQCSACIELDEGRFVDLIEVDAASRAKVDETRDLMDNVQFAPARGRYKVYLIDEVHMFSSHSFNALLKTLEEPPPHVKFLLATTDPQKLPVTVLSRCLQFHMRQLSPHEIVGHLTQLAEAEGLRTEATALQVIGRAAAGSMRDALSLLDQAIAHGAGDVGEADVRAMLGAAHHQVPFDLLEAIAANDAHGMLAHIDNVAAQAPDFDALLGELLLALQRVAVAQLVPEREADADADSVGRVAVLAERLSAEDTQLFYQIGIMGRRDMPYALEARSGFEMILLRMLAFQPARADGEASDSSTGVGKPISPAASSAAASLRSTQPLHAAPAAPAGRARAVDAASASASTRGSQSAGHGTPDRANHNLGTDEALSTSVSAGGRARKPNRDAQIASSAPVSDNAFDMDEPPPHTDADWMPGNDDESSMELDAPAAQSDSKGNVRPVNRPSDSKRPARARPTPTHRMAASADRQPIANPIARPAAGARPSSVNPPPVKVAVDAAVNTGMVVGAELASEAPRNTVPSVTLTADIWVAVVPELQLTGLARELASNTELISHTDGKVNLRISPQHAQLSMPRAEQALVSALSAHMGGPVQIQISSGDLTSESPALAEQRKADAALASATASIRQDPNVQAICDMFDATVDPHGVKPVDRAAGTPPLST